MKIQQVNIKAIQPYKTNNKTHSKEQVDYVAGLIEQYGFTQPLVIDKNHNLIIGHCRLDSATQLGLKQVPCVVMNDLSDEQVRALRIQDNRSNEMGDWDIDNLKIELDELEALDFDIGELGFDDDFLLDELGRIESSAGGETDDDEVPEVSATEPVIKLGDIIELGEHRIMCGDSTSADDVGLLMNGKKADMVFTDPPYGISHSGKGITGGARGNDFGEILGDESIDIALKSFDLINRIYPNCLQIWWGANYYCKSFPNGFGWLVWDKEREGNIFSGCELGFVNKGIKVDLFKHKWHGMIKASEMGQKRIHPTQKPTALSEWCFDNYQAGNLILDLFLGSGSTLIACQKTNRKCYGMELDPKYCDVIIRRYCDYVGDNNIKINGNDCEF